MSKWNEHIAVVLVLLSTVVTVGAIFGYQALRTQSAGVIVIETHAPENGNFQPSEIKIVAGKPAVLEIRNPETVSHGFAIPHLHAGIQEIKPGQVKRITIQPEHPGTYDFYCSTWCTVNHMKMKGYILVTESQVSKGVLDEKE